MTLISDTAKQYEEMARNHVVANFQTKSLQYLLVRLSDAQDSAYLRNSTVAQRKSMARYVYKMLSDDEKVKSEWPSSVERTSASERIIKDLIDSLDMGPRPIMIESLNAYPHLYLAWLYKVLLRLEKKVFIQEESPQEYVSAGYVCRNVQKVNIHCRYCSRYIDKRTLRLLDSWQQTQSFKETLCKFDTRSSFGDSFTVHATIF